MSVTVQSGKLTHDHELLELVMHQRRSAFNHHHQKSDAFDTMTANAIMDSPSFLSSWQCWVLLILTFLTIRTIFVLRTIQRHRACLENRPLSSNNKPIKTLVVLGSGGHTTEMLALLKNVNPKVYTPLVYIVASTDNTSMKRVYADTNARMPDDVYFLPRSREVGQAYLSSIFTTLWSFLVALYYIGIIRPDLVLCNGPGTCLPVAIATLLYRILGICQGNVVFVESFCRVTRYVNRRMQCECFMCLIAHSCSFTHTR